MTNTGGGRTKFHTDFGEENLKEKDHLEELRIDGNNMIWFEVNWIFLSQDKEKLLAVVNTIMNLRYQ
jgi:hypothetical protein